MARTMAALLACAAWLFHAGDAAAQKKPLLALAQGGGTFTIAELRTPRGQPVPRQDVGPVQFLPIRWTNEIESFTPRMDVPRTESFSFGRRIALPDGTRVYRVGLSAGGTGLLLAGDRGLAFVGPLAGNGTVGGIAEPVAASPFEGWVAFSHTQGPGAPGEVYVVRADADPAVPAMTRVTPPGGVVGLNATSLTFARGALFFTSQNALHRTALDTLQTQLVTLPAPAGFVDTEIAVSAQGGHVALRAGSSASSTVVVVCDAEGTSQAAYGNAADRRGVNYDDAGARPQLSLSPDGGFAASFSDAPTGEVVLDVGQQVPFPAGIPLLAFFPPAFGIETELVLGDGPQVVTTLVPTPGQGQALVSLPYPVFQVLVGVFGQFPAQAFNVLPAPLVPVPGGSASDFGVLGHFSVPRSGGGVERFFLVGDGSPARSLVRVLPGQTDGGVVMSGLAALHETALAGDGSLLVRATPVGQTGSAIFRISGGQVAQPLAGVVEDVSRHGDGAAYLLRPTPAGDELLRDGGAGAPPDPVALLADLGSDLQWVSARRFHAVTSEGHVVSVSTDGEVVTIGELPTAATVL